MNLRALVLLVALQVDLLRPDNDFFNLHRGPMLDAHNCYPYEGRWRDRLDRALSAGFPVGIEQDIAFWMDPQTHLVVPKVAHTSEAAAADPSLEEYFFLRVQPLVERTLARRQTKSWPLIILHFDFKSNDPRLLQAVFALLSKYQRWLTTAPKTSSDQDLPKLQVGPVLALTEDNITQEGVFYRDLPLGDRLLLFGSAHTNVEAFQQLTREQQNHALANAAPEILLPTRATNYRRWWNNPWSEVEEGGQRRAGEWTETDAARLRALVEHAHRSGYWIRFYTLDGFLPEDSRGWDAGYNFGSLAAVRRRWQAAIDAGVDLIATDQYEQLAALLAGQRR